MRLAIIATAALLALPAAAANLTEPRGAETCTGVAQDRAALESCLKEVAGPCYATREAKGDAAFAGCLAEAAIAWEQVVTERQLILKPTGHAEGKSGRAARWLATRQMQCRDPNAYAALAAEIGEDAATGAVAQCELTANLIRADQLAMLIDALVEKPAE